LIKKADRAFLQLSLDVHVIKTPGKSVRLSYYCCTGLFKLKQAYFQCFRSAYNGSLVMKKQAHLLDYRSIKTKHKIT